MQPLEQCIRIAFNNMNSIVLVVIVLLASCSSIPLVAISNGDDLLKAICTMNKSMNISLNSSISYNIMSQNTSCVVNGSYSLVIESEVGIADVTCIDQNFSSPVPNIGFVFVGMKNVSVSRVKFEGCGTLLSKLGRSYLNLNDYIASADLFFSSNQSALFVFIGSESVAFNEVNISNYYGFAVIGINLQRANFSGLYVSKSLSPTVGSLNSVWIGSGVLMIYTKSSQKMSSCLVHNSTFYGNDGFNHSKCIVPHRARRKIQTAVALTVLAYDVSEEVAINISKTKFEHNFGGSVGALLITLMNADATTVTVDQDCYFTDNFMLQKCPGGAMGFYMASQQSFLNRTLFPLKVINTTFKKNRGFTGIDLSTILFRHGAIYVGIESASVSISIRFQGVVFLENDAVTFPSCLYVNVNGYVHSYIHVILDNVTAKGNHQSIGKYMSFDTGIFAFTNVYQVELTGNNTFSHNSGTVLKSYRSRIYLNGNNTFARNTARSGAAIRIKDSSLHINCSYELILKQNHVENIGGAIYVENTQFDEQYLCAVQFSSYQCRISSSDNIADNGGNIMYGFPIYNCYQTSWNGSYRYIHDSTEEYTKQFHMENQIPSNGNLEVSSKVDHIVTQCENLACSKIHFPGENFSIKISTLDRAGNNVYTLLRLDLVKVENKTAFVEVNSRILQMMQTVKETKNKTKKCLSAVNVKVSFHDAYNETHKLYLILRHFDDTESIRNSTPIHINRCPPGFALDDNSGYCGCSPAVERFSRKFGTNGNCDINTRTILKPPTLLVKPWLGVVNGNFVISNVCPFEFCRSGEMYSAFKSPRNRKPDAGCSTLFEFTNTNGSKTLPLCNDHRTGALCGECAKNYSVVFGSGECRKCSNWWLWTIVLYVVAGPLLIYLLFSLRLTLTAGTLNGIIFYAQAAYVGILQTFVFYKSYHPNLFSFFTIFLSFLNLDLGFSLCFFDSMDELCRTGLSLVFPVYLMIICAFLIVFSKCSSRLPKRFLKSTIEVTVTVVHLSLSKLLITTIDVFTPVWLHSDDSDSIVWYRDGNIKFLFQKKLIGLMVMTFVITFMFLTPYVILLVCGKHLIKPSLGDKYFRSAYESIHIPYREKRRYWFVVRFFLLITFYLMYASFRSYNVFLTNAMFVPLLIIFLFLQLWRRPFKSKFINILDSFVLIDLIFFYCLNWHLNFNPQTIHVEKYMIGFIVLVMMIFLTFITVVIYHVLKATGALYRIMAVWNIHKSNATCLFESPARKPFLEDNNSLYGSSEIYQPISEFK